MALLSSLSENDVLFIDEIHRLSRQVEEILYPAMEDKALDIIIGKGPAARSIRLTLPEFTLIGATTRVGQLLAPLRDRFGVIFRLQLYEVDDFADAKYDGMTYKKLIETIVKNGRPYVFDDKVLAAVKSGELNYNSLITTVA